MKAIANVLHPQISTGDKSGRGEIFTAQKKKINKRWRQPLIDETIIKELIEIFSKVIKYKYQWPIQSE